jgi:hypothetical protein
VALLRDGPRAVDVRPGNGLLWAAAVLAVLGCVGVGVLALSAGPAAQLAQARQTLARHDRSDPPGTPGRPAPGVPGGRPAYTAPYPPQPYPPGSSAPYPSPYPPPYPPGSVPRPGAVPSAGTVAGITVRGAATLLAGLVLSCLAAGAAGVLQTVRLGSTVPGDVLGSGFLVPAVVTVALAGGAGRSRTGPLAGTALAALILTLGQTGLALEDAPSWAYPLLAGVLAVVGVVAGGGLDLLVRILARARSAAPAGPPPAGPPIRG